MTAHLGIDIPNEAATRDYLAQIRRNLYHDLTLPESGIEIKAKKISLIDMAERGGLPDTLSQLVSDQATADGKVKIDVGSILDQIEDVAGLYNGMCLAGIIYPPLAEESDEDHLGVREIPFNDRQWFFNWCNGEATALTQFRDEQVEPDQDSSDSENIRETAV